MENQAFNSEDPEGQENNLQIVTAVIENFKTKREEKFELSLEENGDIKITIRPSEADDHEVFVPELIIALNNCYAEFSHIGLFTKTTNPVGATVKELLLYRSAK